MIYPPRIGDQLKKQQSPFDAATRGGGGLDRRRKGPRGQATKGQHQNPIVTVFGAGVAGLSAAHELIERGFLVQVVEPARSPDEEYAAEVGGLARNQFGRVPANPYVLHEHAKVSQEQFREQIEEVLRLRSSEMQPVQPRFPVPWRIQFSPNQSGPTPLNLEDKDGWKVRNAVKLRAAWETLKAAHRTYAQFVKQAEAQAGSGPGSKPSNLDKKWRAREVLYVEIRGHTDGDRPEAENRSLSEQWANEVFAHLQELNEDETSDKLEQFDDHFHAVGVGSAEPLGDQRDPTARNRSNRVEFRIVEQLIPCEHGYRFFPAFYRHLFDAMRRTPILDANGHATGETTYDRLVPTADLGLALGDGRPPALLETRRVRSFEELRKLSELFLGRLGVTQRDIARFQSRMLKFLTSSSERRAREYEHQSWWQFLGGEDERGYSAQMRQYLMDTSQALVAMNAEETDARSQGNIVAQLQLHYLKDRSDFTLNGPTSDVWLRHWKKYLKHQGVRFFVGELTHLRWRQDADLSLELIPVTGEKSGWLLPPVREKGDTAEGGKTTEALLARPERRAIVIDVLDADDGDYTVAVSGRKYSHAARGQRRAEIAQALAEKLKDNETISAIAVESRIIIREKLEACFQVLDDQYRVDDSEEPDARTGAKSRALRRRLRALTRKSLADAPISKETLIERLEKHNHRIEKRAKGELASGERARLDFRDTDPGLNDAEWISAGRLRATDRDFDDRLTKFEYAWSREVVPCIETKDDDVVLRPSEWVRNVLAKEDDRIGDIRTLCPYYFRVSHPKRRVSPIWIQVANTHDNLRIELEPIAEDPNHDYLSHDDNPPSFRPEFYVLALPLPEASRIVWRAESDRPNTLHGCLAEILEFDKRTGRRRVTGEIAPIVRDAHGRPPRDYPLRDFAGIQYYFDSQIRIGKGHLYFPNAQWGLSSISQLAYWRERMSSAGPFMGQLSVDIGNFYKPAPARLGTRLGRSGWNSTSGEIAAEVWFQVRQGLERERAGVLAGPSYYNLDAGLTFGHSSGSTFRGRASILVMPESARNPKQPNHSHYTMWVNGERFSVQGDTNAETIAMELRDQIRAASFGGIETRVTPDGNPTAMAELVLKSTVQEDAALVLVTGEHPGTFEILIDDTPFAYVHPANGPGGRSAIRDGLFNRLASDPRLPATVDLSGQSGLLVLPKGSKGLPRIDVRNDRLQLDIIYGPTLRIRLEQCDEALLFKDSPSATIGDNTTPFLINVPGQWQFRPGVFQPDQLTFQDMVLRPADDERIRYRISNRRWVAAGTYMATTTQLTTMESANESARHAVNAILRCIAFRPGNEYNSQGRVFADLANVWDPEKDELDDLEPLKRLDRKLVEEGLPHVMDILKITDAVDAMPMHGKPSHDPVANMLHLLLHLADGSDRDWAFVKQIFSDIIGQAVERGHDSLDPLGLLRELRNGPANVGERIRQILQNLMNPAGSAPGSSDKKPAGP
jgi:hypothetical protein